MSCPFLEEIIVRYCKACEVKKMIPASALHNESPCAEDYSRCQLFQDVTKPSRNGSQECIWAKQKIVSYRLCTQGFDCKSCEFDQLIMDKNGKLRETVDGEKKLKEAGIKFR